MLNEYKEKLEMQREVLKALPRNNGKNNKLYKEKILELIDLYKKDLVLIIKIAAINLDRRSAQSL